MSAAPVGIFCDFDGTISEHDLMAEIGREFAGPGAAAIIASIQRGDLSVRAGVDALFAAIPAAALSDVLAYARARTVIREGFAAFVEDVLARGWRFAVVSGGLDGFVRPALEPFAGRIAVVCNGLRVADAGLAVGWAVPCDAAVCPGGCGLCKPTVLRRLGGLQSRRVVIGDGVTDLRAARRADLVVARDGLARACAAEGLPALEFDTFVGLGARIAAALGGDAP